MVEVIITRMMIITMMTRGSRHNKATVLIVKEILQANWIRSVNQLPMAPMLTPGLPVLLVTSTNQLGEILNGLHD